MVKPEKTSKEKEAVHQEFVKWMVKKANTKDKLPERQQLLSPASRDPEVKPQNFSISKEDLKKAEEHVKRIKQNIK